ncbi:MAG: non-heme iron oxygenase ferredoxin subunit [Acetobacteraceae bacterium]
MAETWVRVAAKDEVPESGVIGVRAGDHEIAVYHLPGDEFRATGNICTHEYAQLSEGWLEGEEIECCLHAARFDVRTGKVLCPPADIDLPVFDVKIEGDDLLVRLPD